MSMKSSPKELRDRRGPKGKREAVRARILDAAAQEITTRGADGYSLRGVAQRAGVTPAMVSYYFESATGMECALLDDGFDKIVELLEGHNANTGSSLHQTIEIVIKELLDRPWLTILMMQGVYAGDRLRQYFVTRHGIRIIATLSVSQEVQSGIQFREDLDPIFARISAIAMVVFPLLARPSIEAMTGVKYDETFAKDFALHIERVLTDER